MPYSYSDIVYILNIIPKRDKPGLIKCIVDISNNTTDDKEKNSEITEKIDNYGQNILNNVTMELKKYI